MSWRKRRKHTKAERKRAAKDAMQGSSHLIWQGWSSKQHYQQWWRKELNIKNMGHNGSNKAATSKKPITYRPVGYGEIVDMPWDWKVAIIHPEKGTKLVVTNKDRTTPASLFAQGGALFLGRDGHIQ